MEQVVDWMESPIGRLVLLCEGDALCGLQFSDGLPPERSGTAPEPIRKAIEAYFAGELGAVEAIPLLMKGTAFQARVWTALREIPPGTTIPYGELARRIGQPGASRAVGLANGANPIAIVVPCHRVIGANGKLTGYGGGLDRKRWLLDHERGAAGLGLASTSQARG